MSQLYIICLTGPSAGLFVKSFWLYRLIHSFRPPDVFVPICQRLDAILCNPSLCIKWRYRDLVHAHSTHVMALAPQYFHFAHKLLPAKERFFVVLDGYHFFDQIFFHTLRLPYIFFVCVLRRVHLRPYRYDFLYRLSSALVLHLSQNFFVGGAR